MFPVQSHWHLQFDADRWILLPSTVVLENIRDFVRSVISARNESAPAKIPDFYANVRSPSVAVSIFLKLHTSVAFEEQIQVYIHTSTIHQARSDHSPEMYAIAGDSSTRAAMGYSFLSIPHCTRLGMSYRTPIFSD